MLRAQIFLVACLLSLSSVFAQRLVRAEYFVDTDPGLGNGTSFTITTGDSLLVNTAVSTSGLTPGLHYLYVRTLDSTGSWSLYEGNRFYIYSDETPSPLLNKAEFFVNADPGTGAATAQAVNTGSLIDTTFNLNTFSSTTGYKQIYGRVRDMAGTWSLYEGGTTYVYNSPATISARLNRAEYFLDTDPGLGNGIPFNTTTGDSVQVNTNISSSAWTTGMHTMYVRVQDSAGQWSLYEGATFYVYAQEAASPVLTGAEFFIDTDQGLGSGYAPLLNAGNTIDTILNINAVTGQAGRRNIYGRAVDMNGRWAMYEGTSFFVYDSIAIQTRLATAEYFFDMDPGTGAGQFLLNTGSDSLAQSMTIPLGSLAQGMHHVYMRFRNNMGAWSHYEGMQFYVTPDEVPSPTLVKAEYFIDSPDPGLGNGSVISFTAADSVNIIQNLGTATIDTGAHSIYVRVMDAAGNWSFYESYAFYMCDDFPVASFTHTELGLTANFNNTSSGALGYVWDFGDGSTFTQASPNYTYSSGGTYTVSLIATNGGCPVRDTAIAAVTVFPAILVSAQQSAVCTRDSLLVSIALTENLGAGNMFYIQLSDSMGSFASPLLIDSVQSNQSILKAVFMPASLINGLHYRVRVQATMPVMTSSDNGSDIAIYPSTPATFTYTGDTVFCSSRNLLLQSTSGAGLIYQWLKDGFPLTGAVVKDYPAYQSGLYRLRVTNPYNCTNTSQQSANILVKPAPVTPFITGTSQVGRNDLVNYSINPATTGSVYTWTIIGGTQLAGGTSSSIIVQWGDIPQLGKVSVTETAVNGCEGAERSINIGLALSGSGGALPEGIKVTPNPFVENLNVVIQNRPGTELKMTVLDAKGSVVYFNVYQLATAYEQLEVPFHGLAKGIYLVRLNINGCEYHSRAVHF